MLSPGHAEKGQVGGQHVKETCLPHMSWLDVETWPWDLEQVGYILREAKLTTIVPALLLSPRASRESSVSGCMSGIGGPHG